RIRAEERRGRTYQGHAINSADDERGGRFAYSGNSPTVTGSTPGPIYPRQPAGSPWAKDECPPEPLIDGRGEGNILGFEIDRQKKCCLLKSKANSNLTLSNCWMLAASYEPRSIS